MKRTKLLSTLLASALALSLTACTGTPATSSSELPDSSASQPESSASQSESSVAEDSATESFYPEIQELWRLWNIRY